MNRQEKFLEKHQVDYTRHRAATGSVYYELVLDRGDVTTDAYECERFVLRVSNHEGFDENGPADWNVCPEGMSWDDAKAAILEKLAEWPGAY